MEDGIFKQMGEVKTYVFHDPIDVFKELERLERLAKEEHNKKKKELFPNDYRFWILYYKNLLNK